MPHDPDVHHLAPSAAREAAALLGASHGDYPSFRQVIPDGRRRRRVLRPLFESSMRDAAVHGAALACSDESGLTGVALWMPPGAFPLSAARKARMTPAMLRMFVAAGRAAGPMARLGTALENAHPAGRHWYLQALGVHPRAQRAGVGDRLVRAGLALATADGAPSYLQTSDPANVAYYERVGFTLTQPQIATFPGGPTYLGMTRPAPGSVHPR